MRCQWASDMSATYTNVPAPTRLTGPHTHTPYSQARHSCCLLPRGRRASRTDPTSHSTSSAAFATSLVSCSSAATPTAPAPPTSHAPVGLTAVPATAGFVSPALPGPPARTRLLRNPKGRGGCPAISVKGWLLVGALKGASVIELSCGLVGREIGLRQDLVVPGRLLEVVHAVHPAQALVAVHPGSSEPQSRCRCGSSVPVQMWQQCPGADVAAVSRCRCGTGEPSRGADVAQERAQSRRACASI
jgi:hypothetical protein